jgi:hypothetical protein
MAGGKGNVARTRCAKSYGLNQLRESPVAVPLNLAAVLPIRCHDTPVVWRIFFRAKTASAQNLTVEEQFS